MRVLIKPLVRERLDEFYEAAMKRHITLGEETVLAKKERLIAALSTLETMQGFSKARCNDVWLQQGWHDFICEDFHFAYELAQDEEGNDVVVVHDAVHSLLYH